MKQKTYRREKLNNFRISHLFVIVGINHTQESLYVFIILDNTHIPDEVLELHLIQNSISIMIHHFKYFSELAQELLMLLKLEVQYNFQELGI